MCLLHLVNPFLIAKWGMFTSSDTVYLIVTKLSDSSEVHSVICQ